MYCALKNPRPLRNKITNRASSIVDGLCVLVCVGLVDDTSSRYAQTALKTYPIGYSLELACPFICRLNYTHQIFKFETSKRSLTLISLYTYYIPCIVKEKE